MSRLIYRYGPGLLFVLPLIGAMIAGILDWIWRPLLSAFTGYTSVLALLCWSFALLLLRQWILSKKLFPHPPIVMPTGVSRQDQAAYEIVQKAELELEHQLQQTPAPQARFQLLVDALGSMARTIAQIYRPGVAQPYSDRTVIELVAMASLAARSLRHWLTSAIPGIEIISAREGLLLMGASNIYRRRQIQIDRIAAGVGGLLLLISALAATVFESETGLVLARGMISFLLLVIIPRLIWRRCQDGLSREFLQAALLQIAGEAGTLMISLSNGALRKGSKAYTELERKLAKTTPAVRRPILPITWRVWLIYTLLLIPYLWLALIGIYAMIVDEWWLPLGIVTALCWSLSFYWWSSQKRAPISQSTRMAIDETIGSFAKERPWPPAQTFDPYRKDLQLLMSKIGNSLGARGRLHLEDLTVPEGLMVVESLAIDLEPMMAAWPLSTVLTIGQVETWLQRATQARETYEQTRPMLDTLGKTWNLTRWIRALTPAEIVKNIGWTIAAELAGNLVSISKDQFNDWLRNEYSRCWRLAGIRLADAQMKSWHPAPLIIDENFSLAAATPVASSHKSDSQPEVPVEREAEDSLSPLVKLAVVGQVKAGKSSLINAILRQQAAFVDVLPATSGVAEYHCLLPMSAGEVVLLDTPGYTDATLSPRQFAAILEAARQAEVVLLVMAANNPAKDPDVQLMHRLQEYFQQHPQERPPLLVGVISKVDLLRPTLEWSPPYQFLNPAATSAKEVSVREVVQYHQEVFHSTIRHWVPVATRLEARTTTLESGTPETPNRLYGIDEYLIPLLIAQLPEAQGLLLLNAHHARQDHWEAWWQTARDEGRKLLKMIEGTLK
ncbi:GTP-binding protein HSR1-related protein [Planctopirus limnophila DSM 3776]|uniref:GTP-binding protein HSR1-related protein n=1 Tax=Planctopirus limnophila (strain ATCC 43296 / DSM 3776 / IFAM 1008 / Mu 290) TaxID=521674 RepID=D5SZ43_PLAL2|nr:GTPase [Planctopirus limnophila]ADG69944.1 GTP-binding protein HSR1-related protein [Planctopirus limnophila DSM 3776]